MKLSFSRRLTLALALLLCGFGLLVGLVGRQLMARQEHETLQRLSQGLARHIVEHWPAISDATTERRALDDVLGMLMVVNPAIEVYVLDGQGRVSAYLGDAQAVRQPLVELGPVRAFLAGAPLPLLGSDPKQPGVAKIFSAATFPQPAGEARPPGYLYVVLEGQARAQVAGHVGQQRIWQGMGLLLLVALALTVLLGMRIFRSLTRPLRRLAQRMQNYGPGAELPPPSDAVPGGDEVQAIAQSFETMAARIDRQLLEQAQAQATHREVVVNVAHDLRTPLTALHGHLEALERLGPAGVQPGKGRQHLNIALDQSNKVRRLSQQLFELASLQSSTQALHVERFRLDELLTDAVQKFAFGNETAVALTGPAPGPVELDGDLQLIERAVTNLIDNALRHAPGAAPVQVSLQRDARQVSVVIEDHGPGLPVELRRRLDAGEGLRDAPLSRPGGGFGGLGLAIAQRIATLHGGSLSTRPAAHGGTILCLALPIA